MKIAVLTLPISINYGGILQAYALQTVLENLGHDVSFLNLRYKRNPFWLRFLVNCKRIVYLYLFNKVTNLSPKESKFVTKEVSRFVADNIKLGRPLYTQNSLYKEYKKNKMELIIYGSDQIWRPAYAPNIYYYFGAFVKSNIKQISYAASFGIENSSEYTSEQLHICTKLLKAFSSISVRESSGIDICRDAFKATAECHLDPTLLLTIEDYQKLIAKVDTKKSKGNLLVYILDKTEEKQELISKIAKARSLTPFYLNLDVHDTNVPIERRVLPSVEQWLRGFYETDYVITDSFHGCVFSILFKKQFVSLGNKVRGMNRFESLLKKFNLEDRMLDVSLYENIMTLLFYKKIDYEYVYNILKEERGRAYTFLRNAIN